MRGHGLRHYVRARLHRRLFMLLGLSILATGVVVSLVFAGSGDNWRREVDRLRSFVAGRYAAVWDDAAARDELASSMARELDLDVTLRDASGRTLASHEQQPCRRRSELVPIVSREGRTLGSLELCFDRHHRPDPRRIVIALVLAGAVLWLASGAVARRIAWPLVELARVAGELGSGKLSARARHACHAPGEIGVLADSFNEMAARIERQIADQRELLAGVSHELRTPLARIRLLVELLREAGHEDARLEDIEREVVEIDALVGELLASARLDFAAITKKPLDAVDVARRALERAGLPAARLAVEPGPTDLEADPTLVARALANLVDNAQKHGRGLVALRVVPRADAIAFEADDAGEGFPHDDQGRLFQPFAPKPDGSPREPGSLGLGLALVKRIAEAHGGRAYATNREEGGARVGLELPRGRGAEAGRR